MGDGFGGSRKGGLEEVERGGKFDPQRTILKVLSTLKSDSIATFSQKYLLKCI